ncbi:SPOR domain-containing protein [Bartonella sp. B30(2025)]
MSDNDRKNPQEIKQNQDDELYDPVERLTRIFNSNTQSKNKDNPSSLQPDQSVHQIPQDSFQDQDFDLSFLEEELESNLAANIPFDNQNIDDQNKQWDLRANNDEASLKNVASTYVFNIQEQNSFLSEKVHSNLADHDEEQILDSLSPLPIQKNQQPQNETTSPRFDPLFKKDDFNSQSENVLFEEPNVQNSNTVTSAKFHEQSQFFSQAVTPQQNTQNVSQQYDDHQSLYRTSISNQHEIQTDEANLSRDHATDYSQFSEERFSKRETNDARNPEYNDLQGQHNNNIDNLSHQNNEREFLYTQNNFNNTQANNFSADDHTRRDSYPPSVDTYKFEEETVEKTGTIIVPEVPYTAPKYDAPVDNLKEEFADVFSVGNASEQSFSQQKQNEIFHKTMQHSTENVHANTQEQNADSFSADNMGYYPPSFIKASPYKKRINERPVNALATPALKNFVGSQVFTRGIAFLTLVIIVFWGYSHFFMSSQKNEEPFIIHADNTPFKLKPEADETENVIDHNLDVYNQTTGQNEKQETEQQFLIDNSETPKDLASLNQQDSENIVPDFFDDTDVEDVVIEANKHTVPTREVQTVIVKQDGTITPDPEYHENTDHTNDFDVVDKTTADQHTDESYDSQEFSDINNNTMEYSTVADADEMNENIDSIRDIENKLKNSVIPIPSNTKFDSNVPAHTTAFSTSSAQATTKNLEIYYVQVASQPTYTLAQNSLQNIKYKFGYLIGSRPLNIQSAFITGKGTYYRVRIQTQNRNEAVNLCESIKNFGGDCFITR